MPSREGKRWRGVVTKNGRKIAQALFDTKSEAREWEASQRKLASLSQATGLLLADAVAQYLAHSEQQFARATHKLKSAILGRFLIHAGPTTPVNKIEPATVQAYLLAQAQKRSAYGANDDRKHLVAFWHWLEAMHDDVTRNPAKRVATYRHEPQQLYTPPEEDMQRVLAVAEGEDKAWLLAYLLTGAREQEVNRLRWSDISMSQGRICLWSRKTRSHALEPQWIDAPPMLLDALDALPRNGEHVFLNPVTNRPYVARRKLLTGLCRKAGVKEFSFHPLRRFVGSILAKSGRPIQEIQHLLRHKNLAHTERYIRGLGVDLTATVQVLEDLISKKNALENAPRLRRVK